jgi:plasmid maintenance system antidote protein VapI
VDPRSFTSAFEYVHGGSLEDLLRRRLDPTYADLRSDLWNGHDDPGFWQAAAAAAGWRYLDLLQGPKGSQQLCFEIEMPDGSYLARPALARLQIGSARCARAGMSRICTSEVTLTVPAQARSDARRCRGQPHPPTATLSEKMAPAPTVLPTMPTGAKSYDLSPAQIRSVRQALIALREHLCTWQRVGSALGFAEITLNHMVTGGKKPTPEVAFRISRLLGLTMDDVLSGRLPDLSLGHPNLDLSDAESEYVRAALRVLRARYGVKRLRQMLALSSSSVEHLISGKHRKITPTLAYRVAAIGGVSLDELLVGKFPEMLL